MGNIMKNPLSGILNRHGKQPPRFLLQRLAQTALLLFALLLGLSPSVRAEQQPETTSPPRETAAEAASPRIACFDRIWQDQQDDVWFYDQDGARVVPDLDRDWLVVRFALDDAARANGGLALAGQSGAPPTVMQAFNERYQAYFSHFLHDAAQALDTGVYRLRRDMPPEVVATLMTRLRQDEAVVGVYPAWRLGDTLQAPLDRVAVTWKKMTAYRERSRLLRAAGALDPDTGATDERRTIAIDPCRLAPWKAANLLAEDIHVLHAGPVLMEVMPPVGVRFSVALNGAMAGAPIPFALEIRFSERVKIESSTIANLNLKPGGIFRNLYDIRYDVPLSAIDTAQSPIRVTGTMRIHATGDYRIPGVPVYFTDADAPKARVQMMKTPETPLRIAAMLPENQTDVQLRIADPPKLAPLDESGAAAARQGGLIMALAGLALLTAAGVATLLWRKTARTRVVRPENHALERRHADLLAWLEQTGRPLPATELAAFATALRGYLAEYAGLPAERRGGSHRLFFAAIEQQLPEQVRQPTAQLLAAVDRALARGEGMLDDASALLKQAASIVETLQADLENGESKG
jgi:hypothetical protein